MCRSQKPLLISQKVKLSNNLIIPVSIVLKKHIKRKVTVALPPTFKKKAINVKYHKTEKQTYSPRRFRLGFELLN